MARVTSGQLLPFTKGGVVLMCLVDPEGLRLNFHHRFVPPGRGRAPVRALLGAALLGVLMLAPTHSAAAPDPTTPEECRQLKS